MSKECYNDASFGAEFIFKRFEEFFKKRKF